MRRYSPRCSCRYKRTGAAGRGHRRLPALIARTAAVDPFFPGFWGDFVYLSRCGFFSFFSSLQAPRTAWLPTGSAQQLCTGECLHCRPFFVSVLGLSLTGGGTALARDRFVSLVRSRADMLAPCTFPFPPFLIFFVLFIFFPSRLLSHRFPASHFLLFEYARIVAFFPLLCYPVYPALLCIFLRIPQPQNAPHLPALTTHA